jgi:hypothetical protein
MRNIRRSYRRFVFGVGVCALLALPATAVAQDALSNPSAAQYQPQSQVQGDSGGNGPTSGPTSEGPTASNTSNTAAAPTATEGASGTLPFTGIDAAVVGGVALFMIGSGLGLRWLSTPRRV